MVQINVLNGLPYILKEDPNFQKLIFYIVNNRSDLKQILLASSDYERNIQENINAVVSDKTFNQTVVSRALDQKNRGVFESPIPLSVMYKYAKKIKYLKPNNWKFIKPS